MADGAKRTEEPGRGQRALFTFLGFALLGPLFAGVVVLAAFILAPPLKLDELLPVVSNPGRAAIFTFVWAAIPAALAGAVLAVVVWRGEAFPWVLAAAAGGIAFMLAAIVLPLPPGLALTPLTALACFIAIAVRASLVSGGIVVP
jgi:hypothetical protein